MVFRHNYSLARVEASQLMQMFHQGGKTNKKITYSDETKKGTFNSETDRANVNFTLIHGGPSKGQASGTNQPMKVLGQSKASLNSTTYTQS